MKQSKLTWLKWMARIWYGNAILAVLSALATALAGDAACFLWAGAAFLECWLAGLMKQEATKTESDDNE